MESFLLAIARPLIAVVFLGLIVYPLAAAIELLLARIRRKRASRSGAQ